MARQWQDLDAVRQEQDTERQWQDTGAVVQEPAGAAAATSLRPAVRMRMGVGR